MGVADNKTYKDQYHFNDKWFKVRGENYPSINDEDRINSTIKDNPEKSNVEIEGREVVLQPDLSALFKAVGKRHSKGGMDVLLKPDSFIFSDDKTLALGKRDHELFELKEGGNFKPNKNTPAAVLKRNVDAKHYNTLVNNINDPKKDNLAKKSSLLMLEKYINTLGNIAYIQEEKKDFPQGIPDFAVNTAPVYDGELKEDIMANKQYRKYGGVVEKFEPGGIVPNQCPCGGKWPNCTPCTPAQLQELRNKAVKGTLDQAKGMNKIGTVEMDDIYHIGTDPFSATLNMPGNVIRSNKSNEQYLRELASSKYKNASGEELARTGRIHPSLIGEWNTKYKIDIPGTDKLLAVTNPTTGEECPCGMDRVGNCIPCPTDQVVQDTLSPNEVTGTGNNFKEIDWQFTPWQKISQATSWGQVANARRYMPTRSRYNATYVDPALLNEQQAVGTARGVYGQQLAGISTQNPILRNAQAASSYGQLLDQIPQIGLSVQNQNVGINNQTRAMNTQIRNQETQQNMQNDQQYYQQSVIGRQNFDNLRSFTANQAMNNTLRDVETNQRLAYNELTQNNPAYSFDFRSGNFRRNPKHILDAQGRTGEDTWGAMVAEAERLSKMGIDKSVISALVRGKFFQQAAPYFQQASTPPPFKRGGRVK